MKTNLIFVFALCAGLALFLSTPATAGDKANKEAFVDCMDGTFKSLEPGDPKTNEVHFDYSLMWYVHGEEDAIVRIEFVTKPAYPKCIAKSPFPSTSFQKIIRKNYGFETIDSKKVDKSADVLVCYSYKITCYKPDGSEGHIIDPIIEVPKP